MRDSDHGSIFDQPHVRERITQVERERDDARELMRDYMGKELERRKQRDRLRALLREMEWVEAWDDEGLVWWFCAICRWDRVDGHANDCRLKAALEGRDA